VNEPIETAGHLRVSERLLIVLVLFFAGGAFIAIIQGTYDPDLGARVGSAITNAMWVITYAGFLWQIKREPHALDASLRTTWLLLMLAMVAVSSTWSIAPKLTLLRCSALIGTLSVGLYLALRVRVREQLKLLAVASTLGACLSFAFVLLFPKYGIGTDEYEGAWFGIYSNKNVFGSAMALAFVVFLVNSHVFPGKRWSMRVLAVFAFLLVFLSQSTTSLVACLIVLALFQYSKMVRSRKRISWRFWVASLLIVALCGVYVANNLEAITTSLGKDPTFTGRTILWYLVWLQIVQRPWLGYGYYAFWQGTEGQSGEVWHAFGWVAGNSHNGLLDLWLDVGLIGMVLFLVTYVVYTLRAWKWAIARPEPEAIWPFLFLVYMMISSLTEATLFRTNSIDCILYASVAVMMSLPATVDSICLAEKRRGPGLLKPITT